MSTQKQVARLIKKVQAGDKRAFTELYELNFDRAYFTAYKMLGNEHEALEITQDVFEYVYQNINKLREPVAFPKWFGLIVHSKCIDFLRGKTRISQYEYDDLEGNLEDSCVEQNIEFLPQECLDSEENRALVSKLVEELPLAQRESVMMYYFEDLSGTEIAEITGVKVDAVYRRLSDARTALRKSLGMDPEFELAGAGAAVAVPVLTQVLKSEAAIKSVAVKAAQQDILGKLTLSPMPVSTTPSMGAPPATMGAKTVGVSGFVKNTIIVGAVLVAAGAATVAYQGATTTDTAGAQIPASTVSVPQVTLPSIEVTAPPQAEQPTVQPSSEPSRSTTPKEPPVVVAPPVITLGQQELYYPVGTMVSPEAIFAHVNPYATDAKGRSLTVTQTGYESVDFYHEGTYVVAFKAHDSAGNQAETGVVSIIIQR